MRRLEAKRNEKNRLRKDRKVVIEPDVAVTVTVPSSSSVPVALKPSADGVRTRMVASDVDQTMGAGKSVEGAPAASTALTTVMMRASPFVNGMW